MLSLRIALRYLFSKKSHNAVNVISIVSMVGVAVATAAIICVLSVFNGFAELSMSRLSLVDPQMKVVPRQGKVIADADSLAGVVASVDGVHKALPSIDDQALAMYRNRQMPIRLIGLCREHDSVVDIRSLVIEGEYNPAPDDTVVRYAALSVGVAARLGAFPGYFDWLGIYAPRRVGRVNASNPMASFVTDSLVVSAVYEVQESDFDASTVIVPLDVARRLFDYTTQASAVDVALHPGVADDAAKQAIADAVGDSYKVLTRLEQQESSFRMIAVEKWITFAMLAFILLIASFNVISTLSMLIIEKKDNIATLRSLGATHGTISRIFMLEGWLISMVGAGVGIVLGVILSLAQQLGGFIKLAADPSQLTIAVYPVRLEVADIVVVLLLSVVVGYFVGLFTSMFMSRRS